MLTSFTPVMYKIAENTNVWCNTYTNLPQLSYLLIQLIYTRTRPPQKGLLLFRKAWDMPVLFSICFYKIHINIKGNMQFVQKVTFEPLMDFKQNHY